MSKIFPYPFKKSSTSPVRTRSEIPPMYTEKPYFPMISLKIIVKGDLKF